MVSRNYGNFCLISRFSGKKEARSSAEDEGTEGRGVRGLRVEKV